MRAAYVGDHCITLEALGSLVADHRRETAAAHSLSSPRGLKLDELWREFVFCILAGTQVQAEEAALAACWLFRTIPESTDPSQLGQIKDVELSMTQALSDIGYRFPSTKAKTISSALAFMLERGDMIVFLLSSGRLTDLRNEVADRVWGVGLKIASHWVRNCTSGMPVIDLHVRRTLVAMSRLPAGFAAPSISPLMYKKAEQVLVDLADAFQIEASQLDYIIWTHARARLPLESLEEEQDGCPLCRRSAWRWNH